jgi:hypothetical protein
VAVVVLLVVVLLVVVLLQAALTRVVFVLGTATVGRVPAIPGMRGQAGDGELGTAMTVSHCMSFLLR